MSFDKLIQKLTSGGQSEDDCYWSHNLGEFSTFNMLLNGVIEPYWVNGSSVGGGSLSGIWVDANFWNDNDSWSE